MSLKFMSTLSYMLFGCLNANTNALIIAEMPNHLKVFWALILILQVRVQSLVNYVRQCSLMSVVRPCRLTSFLIFVVM